MARSPNEPQPQGDCQVAGSVLKSGESAENDSRKSGRFGLVALEKVSAIQGAVTINIKSAANILGTKV